MTASTVSRPSSNSFPDEAVARPDLPDVQPRRDAHLRELARQRLDEVFLVLTGVREEGPHG